MTTLHSPRTAEPLPVDPSEDALQALLDSQRRAFLLEGAPSAQVRRDRLDRFILAVLDHADELTAALDQDFGSRPELASMRSDVASMVPVFEHVRASLEDWMRPTEVPQGAASGLPTIVQHQPKGVIAIIGPWNFPVGLVVQPALEALAAGNRVMIKFSDVPERTAEVFARAIEGAMELDEVAVVRGGLATAQAFSNLQVDHIFFTGSPAVGRQVAAAAGRNLVPVTLELGGKNPAVVGAGADLDVAAARIADTRMINGGQVCLCPDYVFVPEHQQDAFIAAYRRHLAARFPAYATSHDTVSLINDANFTRVQGLVEDAVGQGAEFLAAVDETDIAALPDRATRRVVPGVLLGVTDAMTIAQEEIFGPVLAVFGYRQLDEPIDYINSRPHPLVAYWYGSEGPELDQFSSQTMSGGVSCNDLALHLSVPDVPFGGVGQSGSGAYHGKVGFDAFTHHQPVTSTQLPFSVASFLVPPFAGETFAAERAQLAATTDAIRSRAALA